MLATRGYQAQLLQPDGDKPDVVFAQPTGERAFIDGKCPAGPNYAIKIGAFHQALSSAGLTLFIARSDRLVHSVVSLLPRLMNGPHRATGNGSRTDWYLFRSGGGTPFDTYFPFLIPRACTSYAECDADPAWHCPACWAHLAGVYAGCPDHPQGALQ